MHNPQNDTIDHKSEKKLTIARSKAAHIKLYAAQVSGARRWEGRFDFLNMHGASSRRDPRWARRDDISGPRNTLTRADNSLGGGAPPAGATPPTARR